MKLNIRNGREDCDRILRCGGLTKEEINTFWNALVVRMSFTAVGMHYRIIDGIIEVTINCALPDENDRPFETRFFVAFKHEGNVPLPTGNIVYYRYKYMPV